MNIEVVSTFNSELEKIWRDFEATAVHSPFQSYTWLSHWYNTIGCPLNSILPQIALVRNTEKTLLAIFPLCIRHTMGCSVLEWLGGEQTDYMEPLLSKKWKNIEDDFSFCWEGVMKNICQFDVIHLQKQREYITTVDNPMLSIFTRNNLLSSYQSALENNWDAYYENHTNSKTRQTDRRTLRKLNDIGNVTFLIAEKAVEKHSIIDKMILQKRRRYMDTGVWDMLSVPEYREFYEKLSDFSDDEVKIHCAALCVGDIVVATHVGFVNKSTFYYLMPAHEGGDWEKHSPGRLLLEHLLEWSIQSKLKVFDFTVGGEYYKKDWCDTETLLYEILKATTFKGKIYVTAQKTKIIIKEISWLADRARALNIWLKKKGVY